MKSEDAAINSEADGKISSSQPLSPSLDDTLALFRKIFSNDGTLRIRVIENNHSMPIRCGLIYVDGMIDRDLIQNGITKPFMAYEFTDEESGNPAELMEKSAWKLSISVTLWCLRSWMNWLVL